MATPKNLRITLVQTALHWEQPVKNLNQFTKQLSSLKRNETDLIMLPEMLNTGFSMNADVLAEKPGGFTMQWMAEVANALNTAVCGSLIITEKNKFYNRFIWMNVDGSYEQYDKRHLFRMGKENAVFTAGTESVIISYKGWNICPLVCYDLRFPVWSRNQIDSDGNSDFDLLLYVANWPSVRCYAWNQLLIARAIENQSYLAAVNRVGKDGNEMDHCGGSVVLDPMGKPISKLKSKRKGIETVEISYHELARLRTGFPVMMDADKFRII